MIIKIVELKYKSFPSDYYIWILVKNKIYILTFRDYYSVERFHSSIILEHNLEYDSRIKNVGEFLEEIYFDNL